MSGRKKGGVPARGTRLGRLPRVILLIFLLFLLCGCSQTETVTVTEPDSTEPAVSNALTIPEGAHRVQILETTFEPQEIAIKRGDTVAWVNESSHSRTVTSWNQYQGDDGWQYTEVGKIWDSGDILPSAGFSITFDEIGTFEYTSFSMYIYNTFQSQTIGRVVVTN